MHLRVLDGSRLQCCTEKEHRDSPGADHYRARQHCVENRHGYSLKLIAVLIRTEASRFPPRSARFLSPKDPPQAGSRGPQKGEHSWRRSTQSTKCSRPGVVRGWPGTGEAGATEEARFLGAEKALLLEFLKTRRHRFFAALDFVKDLSNRPAFGNECARHGELRGYPRSATDRSQRAEHVKLERVGFQHPHQVALRQQPLLRA